MDGIEQLICCSVEGEVKGYKALPAHALDVASDRNINQETIRDMTQRKQVGSISSSLDHSPNCISVHFYSFQNLLLELSNLEVASKPSVERKFDEFGGQSTGIPVRWSNVHLRLSIFKSSSLKL